MASTAMGATATNPAAFDAGVTLTPYAPGMGLPLFIQPRDESLRSDTDALCRWFGEHRPTLDELLVRHGAVVLRGFALPDTDAFGRIVSHYDQPDFGYTAGASPRAQLAERVFEATSAPAEAELGMHQEMAYLPRFPSRLAFYCRMPAVSGGSTHLADMRQVTARIDPAFFREIERRGVRYIRNFRDPRVSTGHAVLDSFHKTWTDAFSTTDRKAATDACRSMGLYPEWQDDGSLSVGYDARGLIEHPRTGETLWFNQIATQSLTKENLGDRKALYDRHYGTSRPLPYVTTYGDGTPIAAEHVSSLYPLLRDQTVVFAWSHGDVLLIDNFLTAHGRGAFTGLRDVQVALLG